ncbi:16S rRNA (guanine(527)-N(7))-methyltransferase RsmG [Tessaracoccus lacteus]|uniref:Ribosomal RNA small subunit methyltransferase G n=1 Tax=Tessaracoccus lacteus TaxID=3041766 RepID=A0ABY8PXW6_9ACTN|nr:16S rRNA (guanine(527)-N(7))-methyltransferase RsmG [Tessaracoccus sp. T21]WGT47247.1 16S rRNA (guanine(527)-N(7))-methyltransferase RsmG [Tessaracoccus sp. T21]
MSSEQEAAAAIRAAYPQVDEQLTRYAEILGGRGIEWGLMGPHEGDRLWQRHVGNSLAVADLISTGLDVVDVGSGAGLPGLPVAIARPDLRVTLLEPLLRRANFLSLAVEELGLEDRVEVVRGRAEESKARFDVVVCRAVAPLDRLLKWTAPLFSRGGQLVALKGETAEDEVREASKQLAAKSMTAEVLELQGLAGVEPTRAIRVR